MYYNTLQRKRQKKLNVMLTQTKSDYILYKRGFLQNGLNELLSYEQIGHICLNLKS